MLSKIIAQGFASAVHNIWFRNTKSSFWDMARVAGTSRTDLLDGLMSDYLRQEFKKLLRQEKFLLKMVTNLISAILLSWPVLYKLSTMLLMNLTLITFRWLKVGGLIKDIMEPCKD